MCEFFNLNFNILIDRTKVLQVLDAKERAINNMEDSIKDSLSRALI